MELNLIGTVNWIGLLKFKNALIHLSTGETLDILTEDPETAENVSRLAHRSNDRVLLTAKEDDHFRIRVEKGFIESNQ